MTPKIRNNLERTCVIQKKFVTLHRFRVIAVKQEIFDMLRRTIKQL